MPLRDQPYLPLYVQDLLTDEKLIECSASAHGIYLRLLCLLHKQEKYGLICLKQKYKQNESKYMNFALMLAKQMPFEAKTIQEGITELSFEGVICVEDERLFQKRMMKDGEISLMRAEVGKSGGSTVTKQYGKAGNLYFMSDGYTKHKIGISVNPKNRLYRLRSDLKLPKHFEIIREIPVSDMGKSEDACQLFFKDCLDGEWLVGDYNTLIKRFDLHTAKPQANPENESEYENENVIEDKDKGKGVGKPLRWEDDLIYPFDSDLFKTNWKAHREMREAKHKEYLTRDSEQASLMAISRLTKNETEAIQIIQQSLANGWQDFFKLKIDGKQQTTIDRREQADKIRRDGVASHYSSLLGNKEG